MKASQLLRGYLPIKRVRLPLAGSHHTERTDGPDPDAGRGFIPPAVEVGLLPLSPGDDAEIYERARAYAVAKGVAEPKLGDDLYEYGLALWRCLLGTVDPDSNPAHPDPFFDGGLEQLEKWRELGKTGVLVLADLHRAYQEEVDGQLVSLSSENGHLEIAKELAGPNGGPFWFGLGPGLQATWALTTARLLLNSPTSRSSGG